MTVDHHVARRTIRIRNSLGLHMRAAGSFVRLANSFQSAISVSHDGNMVDGKSVLDLMTLGAGCGTVLALETRGHDAEDAVAALAALISAQFHESDEHVGQPS